MATKEKTAAKSFCLSRTQIKDAKDIKTEKVFVPEWADGNEEAYVLVKSLTAAERGTFEDALVKPESRESGKIVMDMTLYGPKLAVYSMCDDEGNRLFTADDVDMLAGKSAGALGRVVQKAMQLNGIVASAVVDAAKN